MISRCPQSLPDGLAPETREIQEPADSSHWRSFVEIVRERASRTPGDTAFEFLDRELGVVGTLCREGLDRQARAVANGLSAHGVRRGDRVVLAMPEGLDFITLFFGCLYAAVVPVPVPPPHPRRPSPALTAVLKSAGPALLVTAAGAASPFSEVTSTGEPLGKVKQTTLGELLAVGHSELWEPVPVALGDPAFLQYTSGSTSVPRGVVVTHGNLLSNAQAIARKFSMSPADRTVTWLPHYHDMGLLGTMLQPVYCGFPCVFMAPMSFIRKPLHWLRAIDRYGATITGAPPFAFLHCVQAAASEQIPGLDLSCWRVAFVGADTIRAEILENFARVFGPYGFLPEALCPCYGLAESTLLVSSDTGEHPPTLLQVAESDLRKGKVSIQGRRRVAPGDSEKDVPAGVRTLVSCGAAASSSLIAVIDPKTCLPSRPGEAGQIVVSGPSVAHGYWANVEETNASFRTREEDGGRQWLHTGDLGFLEEGELYVAGRLKDILIVRGQNYFPQDIEATVAGAHPAIGAAGVAAFSMAELESDSVVVVFEVDRRWRHACEDIAGAVKESVTATHRLALGAIVPVTPMAIPRTSSGKIRRGACRDLFLTNKLNRYE